ncbi:hypothetical protein [Calothrix sp. NIES-3974]|uniref:hypothetical protein n=1 Tax=Calothrix sp. NIES-3974 TaxID=2005462 RepID=UPI0012FD9F1D|nr:hypothetical protein [Calothrix sp. NIES-3974]
MNMLKNFSIARLSPRKRKIILIILLMMVTSITLRTVSAFIPFFGDQHNFQSENSNPSPQPVEVIPKSPKWEIYAQQEKKTPAKLIVGDNVSASLPSIPTGANVIVSSQVPVPKPVVTPPVPTPIISPTATEKKIGKIEKKADPGVKPVVTPKPAPTAAKPKPTPTSTPQPAPTAAKPKPTPTSTPVAIAQPSPSPTNPNPVKLTSLEFSGYPDFPKYPRSQASRIAIAPTQKEKTGNKISILQTPDSINQVMEFYGKTLTEQGYSWKLIVNETDSKIYEINPKDTAEKLFLHLFTQTPEVIMVLAPQQLNRQILQQN